MRGQPARQAGPRARIPVTVVRIFGVYLVAVGPWVVVGTVTP